MVNVQCLHFLAPLALVKDEIKEEEGVEQAPPDEECRPTLKLGACRRARQDALLVRNVTGRGQKSAFAEPGRTGYAVM